MLGGTVIAVASLLLMGCGGSRFHVTNRPVADSRMEAALLDSNHLSAATSALMRMENLRTAYRRNSSAATRSLAARYRKAPTEARRAALAELTFLWAQRLAEGNPDEAATLYLDTARLCYESALDVADPDRSPDAILYRQSVAELAVALHRKEIHLPRTLRGITGTHRLVEATGPRMVHVAEFDHLVPANRIVLDKTRLERQVQVGFGAAFVGHQNGPSASGRSLNGYGYGYALNASLRFSGKIAELAMQDLMSSSEARISGREVTLAGDFTAPLAYLSRSTPALWRSGVREMLRPGQSGNEPSLHSLRPFDVDKIPLVIVHGLSSTAEELLPFLNLLRGDAVLRERYQVLAFGYPTGYPISYNAAALRSALRDYRRQHDPSAGNPRMGQMVLIGYSMGGILSNLQVRASGDRVYDALFTQSPDELQLDDAARERIREQAFFDADRDIARIIFIAVPHRGSTFAKNPIGRFGARVIRFPFDTVDDLLDAGNRAQALTGLGREIAVGSPNSVNALRSDNPLLPAILTLPTSEIVRFHSIIAQRNRGAPKEEGNDFFVSYQSAHLAEADSEIVVSAKHSSILKKDETIQEVWRILRLNAGRN